MKVKNIEWINFKSEFLKILAILGSEADKLDFPCDCDNFLLSINGCDVNPIFQKKVDFLRVEYDMMLCDTKIRNLAFSTYKDSYRIEVTFKNDIKISEDL